MSGSKDNYLRVRIRESSAASHLKGLSRLRDLLILAESGEPMEDPEIVVQDRIQIGMEPRGRCCYDRCPVKRFPAEVDVFILHGDPVRGLHFELYEGRERYKLHTACKDELIEDSRFPFPKR